MSDVFDQPSYYLHSDHDYEGNRSWREVNVYSCEGEPRLLLSAEIPGIPAEITIRESQARETRLCLRPRPMFAVRGTFEVVDARHAERVGVLGRDGRILDGADRRVGTIADPTTVWARIKEGGVNAAVDAVLSASSGPYAAGHCADELHLRAGDALVGSCCRKALPFTPPSRSAGRGFSLQRTLERVLPSRAGVWLRRACQPSGWRVDFQPGTEHLLDRRLCLSAVILRVELERWGG